MCVSLQVVQRAQEEKPYVHGVSDVQYRYSLFKFRAVFINIFILKPELLATGNMLCRCDKVSSIDFEPFFVLVIAKFSIRA